ncbi:exosortase F system-associated membrane protein [Flavobacterium sp. UBA6135]|uniref:exosortase F system-associated membrane protein n=1 Tax=Flavobacterium sp. UBA6135 TaxID=1946553 RepID=UPI0025BCF35C|nr:exosortase F system-associated protein [Flavobacterium sp. UBA6135]
MLKQLQQDKKGFFILLLCLLGFALLRNYETVMFYDPFLNYFKNDYLNLPFPDYNSFALFWNLLFRYLLNTSLSLLVLYVILKDIQLVKFAMILYLLLFFVLIVAFFILLQFSNESYNFLLFYIRRFLIQPLFLLLFIPAFYIQKNAGSE